MNTTLLFIGSLSTVSVLFKNQELVFNKKIDNIDSLKNYVKEMFDTKILNKFSTVVLDLSKQTDDYIQSSIDEVITTVKEKFNNEWLALQKGIVIRISKESKINFNCYGLTAYHKRKDIEDFLILRDLVLVK